MMLKRSGQVHGIDLCFPFRRPGSVSVTCFGCPEPGFNVPDEQLDIIDEDLMYVLSVPFFELLLIDIMHNLAT
jgi:hypothetical protein